MVQSVSAHLWNNYYFCFPHLSHIYPGWSACPVGWVRGLLGQKILCGVLGGLWCLDWVIIPAAYSYQSWSRYLRSEDYRREWSIKIETIKRIKYNCRAESQTAEVKKSTLHVFNLCS